MDLPKVDIVDPMTGALLDSFVGYKCAEDMVERLSRFRENLNKIFTDFKQYRYRFSFCHFAVVDLPQYFQSS